MMENIGKFILPWYFSHRSKIAFWKEIISVFPILKAASILAACNQNCPIDNHSRAKIQILLGLIRSHM